MGMIHRVQNCLVFVLVFANPCRHPSAIVPGRHKPWSDMAFPSRHYLLCLHVCAASMLALAPASNGLAQTVTTVVSPHEGMKDYVVVHKSGDVYVSNQHDKVFRVSGGEVDTNPFATGFSFVTGLAFASDGSLYASDSGTGEVLKITPEGTATVFASGFTGDGGIGPTGLAFDQSGNLYVAVYDGTIRKVTPTGIKEVLTSDDLLSRPAGLTIDEAGTLYAADFFNGNVVSISPTGQVNLVVQIPSFLGYMTYANGALYATGYNTQVIYRITLDGQYSVFAGSGVKGESDGTGTEATFDTPNGIAVDHTGSGLYVTSDGGAGSLRYIDGIPSASSTGPAAPRFAGYELSAPFPNPASRSTALSFTLPRRDAVVIGMYDILGRRVQLIPDTEYAPGFHSVSIALGDLGPGVYVFTMSTRRGYASSRQIVARGDRR